MNRLVELFLALRFLKPKRDYVSIISIISLLGVTLGVWALIVVVSVMSGFQQELREKIIAFNAHISVRNGAIVQEPEKLRKLLESTEEVTATTPYVSGPVLVQCNGLITTPFIRGIEPESSEKVVSLKKCLIAGEWLFTPESIIVGKGWATKNNAWLGDKVLIHSPRNFDHLLKPSEVKKEDLYLPSEFQIVGIFTTGYRDYDQSFFLIDLPTAQHMYDLDQGVHGIDIRIKDPMEAITTRSQLNEKLPPPLFAQAWMDQNRQLLEAVATERIVMFCLLLLISIVGAFGVCCTLITVTVQKTPQIGLLKALGATDSQIIAVFTGYGFCVGLLGAFIGVSGAILTIQWRNQFLALLRNWTGIEIFPAKIYGFVQLPAVLELHIILIVASATIIMSIIAALVPAWMASRIDPVEALHH